MASTQRELVEKAKRGDHDAFAILVRAAAPRLDAAARLILRDHERAQDAVQEALLRAWRDLPGLRDPDRFDAWLRRLLANSCYDDLRRRRRRIEVDIAELDLHSETDGLASLAVQDELQSALSRLDAKYRALIVLHYYLDLTLPEAARSLDIPLGTAKWRLHQSLGLLRHTLGDGRAATPDLPEGRRA
jgi:RNA polymerase sigma factor (sigma-70 family)